MKSILLVDDDPTLLMALERMLQPHASEWSVTTASDGREAIRSAREMPFDLIITDIFMPDQDGIETIREVRKRWASTRLIAMTGGSTRTGIDFLQVARMLGASEILEKPFSTETFIDAIRRALSPEAPLPALPGSIVTFPERQRSPNQHGR